MQNTQIEYKHIDTLIEKVAEESRNHGDDGEQIKAEVEYFFFSRRKRASNILKFLYFVWG